MSYICTANDLLEWKNFPKGLRILLLDEDINSASEIKTKLEKMEYTVSTFFSEHEALSAISSQHETFHVAIVEVSVQNDNGKCKFLETAKDLPTIMTSKEYCLSTMMKCIALGAVEFLVKPVSEDKLRNIWQHVVHKAFDASGTTTSEPLKSIKEFVGSVLKLQQQNIASQNQVLDELTNNSNMSQNCLDSFAILNFQDQTNIFPVKDSKIFDSKSKSVDNTYGVANIETNPPQPKAESVIEMEEKDHSSKNDNNKGTTKHGCNKGNLNDVSNAQNGCRAKGNRKKFKVDWTPDLHKKFVQAVEKLGINQAIPSRILEKMKVEGLTRHNIASHLQKYRMQRRHILPKDSNPRWLYPSDQSMQRYNYYYDRPVMAFPPDYHNSASQQFYPAWGPQGGRPPQLPAWGSSHYPWQPVETWHWKPHRVHVDAWGRQMLSLSPPPSNFQVQDAYGFQSSNQYVRNSSNPHSEEEVIDKVVNEVISKPWLPLPIGLKPPSIDSVLAALSTEQI